MINRNFYGPGIPDEDFIREPGVPMTKKEIRILTVAELRLFPQAVVYDVGAGTGSVAIECKLLLPACRVYAVEREQRAIRLIKANSDRFGVDLNLIEGAAPEALENLPDADRIFIGGSGGSLPEIIVACDRKLKSGGRMIINSVSVHTGSRAFSTLEALGYEVEAVQVNIAVGSSREQAGLLKARNPVTIISGQKEGV